MGELKMVNVAWVVLVLFACTGDEMTTHGAHGAETVSYAGGAELVVLRGPSSQRLDLLEAGRIRIMWEPVDRRLMDLEIRMRVIAMQVRVFGEDAPTVGYRAEFSQGQYVWSEPPLNFPVATDTTFGLQYHTLPARGDILRVPARQCMIELFQLGIIDAGPTVTLPVVTVSVSFAPTNAMFIDRWPKQQEYPIDGVANSQACPIPIGATEWRVTDRGGQPIAAGALTITTITGGAHQIVALANLANWTPIPVQGFAFRSIDGPFEVNFR